MDTSSTNICHPLFCNPQNTNHPNFSTNNFLQKIYWWLFIIWVPTSTNQIEDQKSYNLFISLMISFDTLKWKSEPRKLSTTFLDLTISINQHTRSIDTTLFEKSMSPYLYIPPHSAHPPCVLRGIIIGMIQQIYHITSMVETYIKTASNLILLQPPPCPRLFGSNPYTHL